MVPRDTPSYLGIAIYTKLQMTADGRAVVISFKRDESAQRAGG
jgi:hypothetical protein